MLDPRRANDPRLSHYLDGLPRLRAWLERAITAECAASPLASAERPTVATASIYLGIKLSEANRLALAVEKGALLLPRQANILREYLLGWARLSQDVDAFMFTVYGALDALAQVLVAVYAVAPTEEVKFPALGRLLADAPAESGAARVGAAVAETLDAPWYRDLRRLRNLVNYRAVLPAAPGGALPLQQASARWADPPLSTLDRLAALAPFARRTLADVAGVVEATVALVEESAVDTERMERGVAGD